jgi:hypothetical protein
MSSEIAPFSAEYLHPRMGSRGIRRCSFHHAVDQLVERFPEATAMLSDAGPDILAFMTCPQAR